MKLLITKHRRNFPFKNFKPLRLSGYKYHAVSGHIHCSWQGIMQHTSSNFSALLLSYSFDIFLPCLTMPQPDPAHEQQQKDRDEILIIITDLQFCLTVLRTHFSFCYHFLKPLSSIPKIPWLSFQQQMKSKETFCTVKMFFHIWHSTSCTWFPFG